MVMKYMVFGFLKVAVIGKVLLQSSGLMKSVEMIWTHPLGVVLALPIKFSFLSSIQGCVSCGQTDWVGFIVPQ